MTAKSVMLCAVALLVLAGCADAPQQPPQQPASAWVNSEDGAISLRLGAPDTMVDCEDPITVVVELRNNSGEIVTVLRPFGDRYEAVAVGVELIGPDTPLRYAGPQLE